MNKYQYHKYQPQSKDKSTEATKQFMKPAYLEHNQVIIFHQNVQQPLNLTL